MVRDYYAPFRKSLTTSRWQRHSSMFSFKKLYCFTFHFQICNSSEVILHTHIPLLERPLFPHCSTGLRLSWIKWPYILDWFLDSTGQLFYPCANTMLFKLLQFYDRFAVWQYKSSNLVFHDYFGYSQYSAFPWEFQRLSIHIQTETCWDFYWDYTDSVD